MCDINRINQEEKEAILSGKTKYNFLLFAIPAFMDCIGTTINKIGLLMMDTSVWQMMRASLVIFVTLFSVIFLKRKLYRHHFTSLALMIIGTILVGLSRFLFGKEDSSNNRAMGFVAILFS